jgi:hypothetical protein
MIMDFRKAMNLCGYLSKRPKLPYSSSGYWVVCSIDMTVDTHRLLHIPTFNRSIPRSHQTQHQLFSRSEAWSEVSGA